MQHFANFNVRAGIDAVKKVGSKVAGLDSVKIGASIGAAAGLAKGAGIGESEEEKARTTTLGRIGKLVGKTAVGGAAGGAVGMATGDVAKGLKRQYKKSEIELSPSKISNNSYGYKPNANFGFEQVLGQVNKLSDKAYQYAKVNPTKVLAGAGAVGGALQGTGLAESEEERANTSGWGRLGKIAGNAALGGTLGAGIGTVAKKADQLGADAARNYFRKPTEKISIN